MSNYNYMCIEQIETKSGPRFTVNWEKTSGFKRPEGAKEEFISYAAAQKWVYFYAYGRNTLTSLIGGQKYSTLVLSNPIKNWEEDRRREIVFDEVVKAEEGITYIAPAPPSRKRQRTDTTGVKEEPKLECDEELTAWTKAPTEPISEIYTQADCE